MSTRQKGGAASPHATLMGGSPFKSGRAGEARRKGPRKRPRLTVSLGLLFVLLPAALRPAPSARTGKRARADASAQNTPLRQRQDIRAVEASPDDLKNLRHAFFMLKKATPTCGDPDAKSEYDCWADFHNNFDLYGCLHRIDLFWPWHRYHLAGFENALRNSDPANPDRVRNVTLPYWNWTQPPSGTNFPKSLEQQFLNPGEFYPEDCPDASQPCQNPLWAGGRRKANEGCQSVKPACVQEALQLTTWRDFGGGVRSGQIGDFELQAHNYMHGDYIGGLMANTTTAAQDPIYWLFHAYIDNVWDQWQKLHQANPCDPANVPDATRTLGSTGWPPNSVRFKDALCAKDLGYEYAAFGPPLIALLPSCPPPNSSCLTSGPATPVALRAASVASTFDSAELSMTGVTVPSDFSYNALVLLHPRSVRYDPADKSFPDKYTATYFVAWKHPAHAHGGGGAHAATMDVKLDVTRRLKQLAQGGGLNNLAATIVFAPSDTNEKATPLVFRRDINFASASLVVKAGRRSRAIPLSPAPLARVERRRRRG